MPSFRGARDTREPGILHQIPVALEDVSGTIETGSTAP
jgi:hypothetical protein